MTEKIEALLDNIQHQSTLGKLLLPMILLFLIVMIVVFFHGGMIHLVLIIAAMLAFYLAVNIGANDVANNM